MSVWIWGIAQHQSSLASQRSWVQSPALQKRQRAVCLGEWMSLTTADPMISGQSRKRQLLRSSSFTIAGMWSWAVSWWGRTRGQEKPSIAESQLKLQPEQEASAIAIYCIGVQSPTPSWVLMLWFPFTSGHRQALSPVSGSVPTLGQRV